MKAFSLLTSCSPHKNVNLHDFNGQEVSVNVMKLELWSFFIAEVRREELAYIPLLMPVIINYYSNPFLCPADPTSDHICGRIRRFPQFIWNNKCC